MPETLTEKVNFGIIRYANCWEDADVLLEGLTPAEGSHILSIGSAGDNSLSLLTTHPEIVVAVDVNAVQLYLIELKKVVIKTLAHEEALAFLGFASSTNRSHVFHSLKHQLSGDANRYWEAHLPLIETGIIYAGKFEKYFLLFRHKILPWIHSQKTTEELLSIKTEEKQRDFYNEKWNTWRWRLLFKIFFSRYVMGRFGRDPAFLKEVNISVGDYIYGRAAAQLQSVEAQQNFMIRFNLSGHFGDLYPHYLRKENYETIKVNIDKLQLHQGYAQEAIPLFGRFDCMNLSNIFEYMNEEVFLTTAKQLVKGLQKEGKLAYWNLMVNRRLSAILPDEVVYENNLSEKLTKKDKGFFYNQFIIDRLK